MPMGFVRGAFSLALFFLLPGCGTISTSKQIDNLKESFKQKNLESKHSIKNVPFVKQLSYQCGPASLYTVSEYWLKTIDKEQLIKNSFDERQKGSLYLNVMGAARRAGFIAITINNIESLLLEVRNDHPIIVLQNLALSWWPQWHFSVVTGYDLELGKIKLNNGENEGVEENLNRFLYQWDLANNKALVVLPANTLSTTASELEHISAISILENLNLNQEAQSGYEAVLKKWPSSLGAYIGLGNIYFTKGEYQKSADILSVALKKHPESQVVRHNLDVAQKAVDKK